VAFLGNSSAGPSLLSRGGSIGLSKPLGLSKPSSLGLKSPPLGLRGSSISKPFESSSVKQEWSAVTAPSVWNVKGEDLEPVPEDYPLERTHRAIFGQRVEVVSSRISEVLRSLSIEADYDSQKAKVRCKTEDLVSFRIRLYAGGENADPVIVEVQRRSGSASSFMNSCRAILNAAEGKKDSPRKMTPFSKPLSQMKCLDKVRSVPHDYEADAKAALDGLVEMLRNKNRETNRLAMDNLYALTDPVKTSRSVAIYVSKCVALGDNVYDIREDVRSFTERDVFGVEQEEEEELKHYKDQLRQLALAVFANAVSVCEKEGILSSAIKEQKWFADCLIPTLVEELKRVDSDTCNACSAASSLCSLITCSEVARRVLIDQGGFEALEAAFEFGSSRHALLATNAELCLKFLESYA
jgi:hypothetical protein